MSIVSICFYSDYVFKSRSSYLFHEIESDTNSTYNFAHSTDFIEQFYMKIQRLSLSKIILWAFLLNLCITPCAHAYLDAGTGSMLIQGLFGAIVAGMVIIKGYWSKIKSWCSSTFSSKSAPPAAPIDDAQEKEEMME